MEKDKRKDYAQEIRNSGPQEVSALKKRQGRNKSKAVRGRDLRSGK